MKTSTSIAAKLLVVIAFMHARPSNGNQINPDDLCQESPDGTAYFVADPDNCSKYFMCQPTLDLDNPWMAINMTCAGNLQFDTELDVCNYPEEVGCVDKNTPVKAPVNRSSNEDPISKGCQESENGMAYFLADPDNCSDYYMCQKDPASPTGWDAIHMSCPPHLLFDTALNICNYAGEVDCADHYTTVKP